MPAPLASGRTSEKGGSSRRKTRSTGRNWLIRGGLALVVGWVASNSLSASLASVLQTSNPAVAAQLAPSDGRLLAKAVANDFSLAPSQAIASDQARQAQLALQHDATAAEALSVLGMQAQLRGDNAAAEAIFRHAGRITRRELQPHLWAIEEAVARGDITGAVQVYDRALRSSAKAQRDLMPVLISAAAEPDVRSALVPILLTRPVWAKGFIQQASVRSPAPLAIAQLIESLANKGYPVTDDVRANAIHQLVGAGQYADAWSYYTRLRPGAQRNQSRDRFFVLSTDSRTSFDWTVGTADGLSAGLIPVNAIAGNKAHGMLDFALPPGLGATVVTQDQWLPAGRYRLSGRSLGLEQPDNSRPYWALSCRNGKELGRIAMPASSDTESAFSGEFTVPADCPMQRLALVARSVSGMAGSSGQILEAHLEPLR